MRNSTEPKVDILFLKYLKMRKEKECIWLIWSSGSSNHDLAHFCLFIFWNCTILFQAGKHNKYIFHTPDAVKL